MKKALLFLLLLVALGCSRGLDSRVALADSLMWERPDSALSILESIDTASLTAPSDRARYALLLTQARHKNNIFETDDSLITLAVSYYDEHGPDSCSMLAHFYKGCINSWNKENAQAVTETLTAKEIAEKLNKRYWLARIYDLMADAYYRSYNMESSIRYYKQAAAVFEKEGYIRNAQYALLSASRSIQHNGDDLGSIALLDSMTKVYNITVYNITDSALAGFIEDSYFRACFSLDRLDEALHHYNRAKDYWRDDVYLYLSWAEGCNLYIRLNNLDSARTHLEKARVFHHNKNSIQRAEYAYRLACHDTIGAFICLNEMHETTNEEIDYGLKQNLAFVEKDYYDNASRLKEIHLSHTRTVMWLVIVICLFISVGVVCYFRQRAAARKKDLETSLCEIRSLSMALDDTQSRMSGAIEDKDRIISDHKKVVEQLFSSHFLTLDNLSRQYFDVRDNKSVCKPLVKDFEKEIERLKSDKSMAELISLVNFCNEDIINKYSLQFPKSKQSDLNLIALYVSGLSIKTISLLMDLTVSGIYSRLSRMRDKIENSDAPDRSLFMKYLGKSTT